MDEWQREGFRLAKMADTKMKIEFDSRDRALLKKLVAALERLGRNLQPYEIRDTPSLSGGQIRLAEGVIPEEYGSGYPFEGTIKHLRELSSAAKAGNLEE